MEQPTPRVNFEAMQRFQGRMVLLSGEVKGLGEDKVVLRTSDDAEVVVLTNRNATGSIDSPFVEVSCAPFMHACVCFQGDAARIGHTNPSVFSNK